MSQALLHTPLLRAADRRIRELDPWTLERQMELAGIPAPPFGEGPRGERMAQLFEEVGLEEVEMDEVGNVLGTLTTDEGDMGDGPLILSAHLDTVFPPGTDVRPRWEGEILRGPGVADDGRGLACLLTLGRVLEELHIPLPFPLLFVATVGEEGVGNLRGVRHLFRESGPGREVGGFISLDGVGVDRIVHRGVGSTRLRLEIQGPGGHSWADWGRGNPIHALARIVARVQNQPELEAGRSTLTAARWGGGTSINVIPRRAWAEMDLRSESPEELERLEERLLEAAEEALDVPGPTNAQNGDHARAGAGDLSDVTGRMRHLDLRVEELGRRPAGRTPEDHPLVRAAEEATRILGGVPRLVASSTDANLPMSLGVPAITLGGGGTAGGIHTVDEWYRNERGPEGVLRALLTLLLLTGH